MLERQLVGHQRFCKLYTLREIDVKTGSVCNLRKLDLKSLGHIKSIPASVTPAAQCWAAAGAAQGSPSTRDGKE